MKTTLRPVCFLPFIAAGVLLSSVAMRADVRPSSTAPAGVRTVTRDVYKDYGFDKLRGAPIRGADGRQLGHVRDLILDARSGELRFVLVSDGGFAGMGGDSRVLPVDVLIRDPKERGFLTRLQRVDWELLPVLDKADIKDGRIELTSAHRRNLTQLRDQNWARAFDALGDAGGNSRVQRFVFASALSGQALYGENEKVGKVEDVYVDPAGGAAMAVVAIDDDFTAGVKHEYLVPIDSLEVPAGANGRVHTTLTAARFQEAAGIAPDTAQRDAGPWERRREHARSKRRDTPVEQGRIDTNRNRPAVEVTPTGYPGGFSQSEVQGDLLTAAARSVADGWASDPDLRRFQLNAAPERDRLVLTGSLPSRALAERAEDVARHAASRVQIDNRIRADDNRR
jgi:sporulation protein YlmC with PRC-barrel domain